MGMTTLTNVGAKELQWHAPEPVRVDGECRCVFTITRMKLKAFRHLNDISPSGVGRP